MSLSYVVFFYKKLKKYFGKKKFSLTTLLKDLKALKAIELTVEKKPLKLRTELRGDAGHVFKAIGMRPPNRILSSELDPVVKRL
jgi:hypothetical protein